MPPPPYEAAGPVSVTVVAPPVATEEVDDFSTTNLIVAPPPDTTSSLSSSTSTSTPSIETSAPAQLFSDTQSTQTDHTLLVSDPLSTSASTTATEAQKTSVSLLAAVGALGALVLVLSGIFLVFIILPRIRRSRFERARATSWIPVVDHDDDPKQGGLSGASGQDGGIMREVEAGFVEADYSNHSGPVYGSVPSADPDSISAHEDMSQSRSDLGVLPSSAVSLPLPSAVRRDSTGSKRSLAPWSVEQTKRSITGFLQPRSRSTKPQPSSPCGSGETQETLYDGVTPSPYQKEYLQYDYPSTRIATPPDATDSTPLNGVDVPVAITTPDIIIFPTSPDQEVISQITALLSSSSANHTFETAARSTTPRAPLDHSQVATIESTPIVTEDTFDDSNPPAVPPKEPLTSPPTPLFSSLTPLVSSAKHETVRTPHQLPAATPSTPTAMPVSATASPSSATAALEMARGWFRPSLRKKSSTGEKPTARRQPWEVDPSPTSPLLQFFLGPGDMEAVQTDEPESMEDLGYYTVLSPLRRPESNGPLSPPSPSLVHPTFSIHAIRKLPPVSITAIPSFPDPQFTSQLMKKKAPVDYLPDSLIINDGKRLSTIAEGGSVSDVMSVRTKSTSYERWRASQDQAFSMSPAHYSGFALWDSTLPAAAQVEETLVSGSAQGGSTPEEVSLFMVVRKQMEEPDRPKPKGPLPLPGPRRTTSPIANISGSTSGGAGLPIS